MGFILTFSYLGISIDVTTVTLSIPFFTIPKYLKLVLYFATNLFFLRPGLGIILPSHGLSCAILVPSILNTFSISIPSPGLNLTSVSVSRPQIAVFLQLYLCFSIHLYHLMHYLLLNEPHNLFLFVGQSCVSCDHVDSGACETLSLSIALPQ